MAQCKQKRPNAKIRFTLSGKRDLSLAAGTHVDCIVNLAAAALRLELEVQSRQPSKTA